MFVLLKLKKRPPTFISAKFISKNAKNEIDIQLQKMPEGLKEFNQAKLMLMKGVEPTEEMHKLFVHANKNPDHLLIAQRIEALEFLVNSKFSTKENIISNYKTMLELDPDNTEYLSMYAEYLMDIEDFEESTKIWRNVLTLEPKNLIASVRLADCYIHLEVYEEVEELLSQALMVQHLNPQLHEKKANLLFKLEKYEECLEFCQKALESHKNSKILKNTLLKSLFKSKNNFSTFLEKLDSYAKEYPSEESTFYHEKIMSLIETEQYKEALKAIKSDDPKSDAYKAMTYKKMGELALAESLFIKAIEANPNSDDLHYQLGMILYDRDDVDSMVHFDKALEINPKHIPSLLMFAESQMRLGAPKEALNFLNRAIDLNPNNIAVLIEIGRCYGLEGEFKSAIQEFDKVLAIDPGNVKAMEKKGTALIGLDKPREGIVLLEKCLSLGNEDSHSVWNNLGTAYFTINNFKKSIECFDRGLLLNPGAKDLKENRDQAILHNDMARDAIRMASSNYE
jgi:tetratricopeptide (TPR) repeat protein